MCILSVFLCITCAPSVHTSQESMLNLLELEFWWLWATMYMPGMESGSSTRTRNAINFWTITLPPIWGVCVCVLPASLVCVVFLGLSVCLFMSMCTWVQVFTEARRGCNSFENRVKDSCGSPDVDACHLGSFSRSASILNQWVISLVAFSQKFLIRIFILIRNDF